MSHCDSVTVLRDLTSYSFHRNWEDRNNYVMGKSELFGATTTKLETLQFGSQFK